MLATVDILRFYEGRRRREDLPLALCWFAMPQTCNNTTNANENNLDSEFPPEILQKRPTDDQGPFWSWASIDDAAFMYPAADGSTGL